MKIRKARAEDSELVFGWANDPVTRASSISTSVIEWPEHTRWFAQRLEDSETDFFIVLSDQDEAIGTVRFEFEIIGVNIAPSFRGQGIGTAAIRIACEEYFKLRPDSHVVIAFIRPENRASQHAFEKAGFVKIGEQVIRDVLMHRFELGRG
ncbi:MAG: GNAT family N-acetyltransferase [Actinomycetota bacterium]